MSDISPRQSNESDVESLHIGGNLEHPEEDKLSVFRQGLTNKLLHVFAWTVGGGLVLVGIGNATGHDVTNAVTLLHEVIPVETSLLGTAIGYYFGEALGSKKNK